MVSPASLASTLMKKTRSLRKTSTEALIILFGSRFDVCLYLFCRTFSAGLCFVWYVQKKMANKLKTRSYARYFPSEFVAFLPRNYT